jgi:hypothetical protein
MNGSPLEVSVEVASFRRVGLLRPPSIRALERAALLKRCHPIDDTKLEDLEYKARRFESELAEKNEKLSEYEATLAETYDKLSEYEARLADLQRRTDPHLLVKRFSKIGVVLSVFALGIYWISDVMIVNPAFSIFGIVACLMMWVMAVLDTNAHRRRSQHAPGS